MPLADLLPELLELEGKDLTPRATEVLLKLFTALFERTEHQVTREEMRLVHEELRQLRAAVAELAEAQARTEMAVRELAAAQARTEARVEELAAAQARTEARVEELAAAQARTEARVEELAAAQARTEARVEELAAAQARTEARVEELATAQRDLAAAQARTERALTQLAEEFYAFRKEVREEFRQLHKAVGGLAHTVGYTLENLAYRTLPRLLRDQLGWEMVEALDRVWLVVGKTKLQVNLWGLARTPEGELVRLVGECKVQLGAKHLEELAALLEKSRPHWSAPRAVGLLVTHMPDFGVREAAEARGYLVFTSRQLEAAP